jgi:hypothetical protein
MRKRLWVFGVDALVAVVAAAGGWQASASAAPAPRTSNGISTVLASRQGSDFRYFPHFVGTAHCAIPFVFRSVQGTCSTLVSVRRGYSGRRLVTFKERWLWRAFHYSGAPRRTLRHWWVFDVLPSGRVIFVKHGGDFPPNFAL